MRAVFVPIVNTHKVNKQLIHRFVKIYMFVKSAIILIWLISGGKHCKIKPQNKEISPLSHIHFTLSFYSNL